MPFYPPKGSKSSGDSIITQSFKRTDPNDINGSTKVQISIIRGGATAEEVLRTIHEFKQAIPIMGWTTGSKKYNNFTCVLQGSMKDRWQKIISGVSQTNDNFSDSLQELIQYTCPKSDAFMTQWEHLLNAKKNRETTVQEFCERLEVLNSYSQHLQRF